MGGSTSRMLGVAMLVGGGDRRWIDRFRDNSTWAFFEWDGARCGMAGVSRLKLKLGEAMAGRTGVIFASKNDFASVAGVTGVAGPLLSTEEVSLLVLLRKLRSMVEKSESLAELIDPADDPETSRMSGAVKAWTLVVEISSVGKEIRLRSMVPGAYLTVVLRSIGVWFSVLRLTRLVKARERDIAEY